MEDRVLIASSSFEDRSTYWVREFLDAGNDARFVFLANVFEPFPEYERNHERLIRLGVKDLGKIDRFSSMSLWRWVARAVDESCKMARELAIDITCMPRELIGMLLFAISVNERKLDRISIKYVSAPEGGYATTNSELPESDRWLSEGVFSVRSIVGYPGVFRSERPCHLIVFAGHESHRITQLVEYVEPRRLTISGEVEESSIVREAGEISLQVADELKSKIQIPEIGSIGFSSSSIEKVYNSLLREKLFSGNENFALAAMNTKLSFVGAALFALSNRTVRMMYTVPLKYNPSYCLGIGEPSCFEITPFIRQTNVEFQ